MRRIILLPQVYPPEIHPTAVMFRELAEHLSSHGWRVTVCAGWPHHPGGALYSGWQKAAFQQRWETGIQVLRRWHHTSTSRKIASRLAVFASQTLSTTLSALRCEKADLVLVCGPPLVGPLLAALVAARHRAPLVNVIYDIYPDVAEETGKLTNRHLLRAARLAEKLQYAFSDRTVVLSDGFRRTLVARGVPYHRVDVVPVWLDSAEIRPLPHDNAWRREQAIDDSKTIVLYAGTIGIVSGAEIVAEAAHQLRDQNILFLFVGEGEYQAPLRRRCQEMGLANVRFLPFQPRERLAEVQATADIALVTLAKGRARTSVPSKVVAYMAAGRPVIASVDSESDTAAAIEAAGCGIVTPPADGEALAKAILELASDRTRRQRLGESARAWFEAQHGLEPTLSKYREALARAMEDHH